MKKLLSKVKSVNSNQQKNMKTSFLVEFKDSKYFKDVKGDNLDVNSVSSITREIQPKFEKILNEVTSINKLIKNLINPNGS